MTRRLVPARSEAQSAEAELKAAAGSWDRNLANLAKLALAGLYHQTDTIIGVKPGAQEAFIIERFQTEMLEMAIKSFDTVQRSDRMSASTTFSISKATFDLFKMRTREFRKELLEIAKLDNEPDRVVQFTFNLFPLSQGKNKK